LGVQLCVELGVEIVEIVEFRLGGFIRHLRYPTEHN
jgi:hypothetical protein